jgi:aspartyl/glutamyl-tRNA(Asn/Gln) amidotransferase C subunit
MLTDKDLEKLTKLAKLQIPSAKKKDFLAKLTQIFGWIDQLTKINVSQVGTSNCSSKTTKENKDEPIMMNTREELLANANYQKFELFTVPKSEHL